MMLHLLNNNNTIASTAVAIVVIIIASVSFNSAAVEAVETTEKPTWETDPICVERLRAWQNGEISFNSVVPGERRGEEEEEENDEDEDERGENNGTTRRRFLLNKQKPDIEYFIQREDNETMKFDGTSIITRQSPQLPQSQSQSPQDRMIATTTTTTIQHEVMGKKDRHDFVPFDNKVRSLLRGTGLSISSSSSSSSSSLKRRKMVMDHSNDVELVYRFNLRLYWGGPDYCWQEESIERRWCLECPGNMCNENDILWITECNTTDTKQHFVWIGEDDERGRLSPYTRPDLCWQRIPEMSTMLQFKLRSCNETENLQLFSGFNMTKQFELHPEGQPNSCMTNDHHPRAGEFIYSEPCDIARFDNTSQWIVDSGSIASKLKVTPRSNACTRNALLESGQKLQVDDVKQVTHPFQSFIQMQRDGNLIVRMGTIEKPGQLIWKSDVYYDPKLEHPFETVLQGDGHLLTRYFQGPNSKPKVVFKSMSVSENGQYYLALNCDGKSLSVFRTGDEEAIWTTEPLS